MHIDVLNHLAHVKISNIKGIFFMKIFGKVILLIMILVGSGFLIKEIFDATYLTGSRQQKIKRWAAENTYPELDERQAQKIVNKKQEQQRKGMALLIFSIAVIVGGVGYYHFRKRKR